MSNQQQSRIKQYVSADDLEKALAEREKAAPETSKSQVPLAEIFDDDVEIKYTSSHDIKHYFDTKNLLFWVLLASALLILNMLMGHFLTSFMSAFITFSSLVVLIFSFLGYLVDYYANTITKKSLDKLYLNDNDFKKLSERYDKAQNTKNRNLIIGSNSICLGIMIKQLYVSILEIPAIDWTLMLLIVGVTIIGKTFFRLNNLKTILNADETNHKVNNIKSMKNKPNL